MIDNTGDAVEDITYQFQFRTEIRNPNTFLYSTGPVSSFDDPDLNVQFFNLTRVIGPRRTGTPTLLAANLSVLPANVGRSSILDYNGQLGSGVFGHTPRSARLRGPREEGFYIDLGATFDLLQLRTARQRPRLTDRQRLAGFNKHSRHRAADFGGDAQRMRPASRPIRTRRSAYGRPASRRSTTTRSPGGQCTGATGFRCRALATRSSTKS